MHWSGLRALLKFMCSFLSCKALLGSRKLKALALVYTQKHSHLEAVRTFSYRQTECFRGSTV